MLECSMHGHEPGVDTAKRKPNKDKTSTSGAATGLNQPVSNWLAECTLRPPAETADSLERHYPDITRQVQTRNKTCVIPGREQYIDDSKLWNAMGCHTYRRYAHQPINSLASCARFRRKSLQPHVQDLVEKVQLRCHTDQCPAHKH